MDNKHEGNERGKERLAGSSLGGKSREPGVEITQATAEGVSYSPWPAVSQISNFTVASSSVTVWVKNAAARERQRENVSKNSEQVIALEERIGEKGEGSEKKMRRGRSSLHRFPCRSHALPPMVGSWNSKNSSRTNRTTKHDFPTAESPRSTSLK